MARNILISGGSRGIGEACVRAFCEKGDRVGFFYRSAEEKAHGLEQETGAVAIRCDISKSANVKEAYGKYRAEIGECDVLVSNAGISSFSLFQEISDEMWEEMISVNLSGAFYLSREVVPAMIGKKSGRIIYIGSMWGKTGASCEVHYSASKSGLRGMTMALAKELGPSEITVNCIEPGVIETDMNRMLSCEAKAELLEATPLMRLGSPMDVARAVCFLASEEASFITGQILGVDGGFAV